MRLLLDTRVALWAIAQTERLPRQIKDMIAAPANDVLVSAGGIREIVIKHSRNRGLPGDMPLSGAEALGHFRAAGYLLLNILPEHALAVEALPPPHGDPFDRLLVAQALTEPPKLITRDPAVAAYGEGVVLF